MIQVDSVYTLSVIDIGWRNRASLTTINRIQWLAESVESKSESNQIIWNFGQIKSDQITKDKISLQINQIKSLNFGDKPNQIKLKHWKVK